MKMINDRTIQPVIDYGCSVWYNTTSKNLEKNQKIQNYAARIISGNFDYINVRSISLIRLIKMDDDIREMWIFYGYVDV